MKTYQVKLQNGEVETVTASAYWTHNIGVVSFDDEHGFMKAWYFRPISVHLVEPGPPIVQPEPET